MARSRGVYRGRQSPRRSVGWDFGPGGAAAQTQISATGSVIATSVANVLEDGLTLVRLRGRFHAYLSTASGAQTGFTGAFGIAVVTAAAAAAGAASVPTPITEQDWDGWLYWQSIGIFSAIGPLTGAATELAGITGQIGH